MKKESEGVVIEVSETMAKVKANRHGDCKNCGACPGDNATVLDAQNPIGALPGQRVIFELKEVNMLKAAFVVYILPLVAILVGCIIGTYISDKVGNSEKLYQVGGGAFAFILSIFYVKHFDKSAHSDKEMQPVITRIK